MRPWLFKILHNCLHSRRAKDRRGREVLRQFAAATVEEGGRDAGSPPGGELLPTAADVNWDGLDERLCRAIRLLPVAHRVVFLLAAVENLKYREIADVVNVPVGTVMSRLSRARAVLAAQLSDLAAEQNIGRGRRTTPAGPDA